MYFNCVYYNENNEITSLELECEICSNKIEVELPNDNISIVKDNYCIVRNGGKILCKCGNRCQSGTVGYKEIKYPNNKNNIIYTSKQSQTVQANAQAQEWLNKVHCPYCNSTNCKKISGVSKATSVAMFGIFSQKVKKQWHCNNCRSDF
jgi:hypothetical protein